MSSSRWRVAIRPDAIDAVLAAAHQLSARGNQTGQISSNQTGQTSSNQTGQTSGNQTGQISGDQTRQISGNQTG